jgi:Mce-associated membrane protein
VTADKTSVEETAEVEETSDAEKTEDTAEDGAVPDRRNRVVAALKKRPSGKVFWILLALPLVASLALLGGLFYYLYLPDRATDPAAAKSAISAASEGAIAVLSYTPETLDHDFASARSHLTGEFLTYYNQFTQQIVAPAAKQKSVKTSAVVLRAALSQFQADSATVLLFINQSTQSKDRPEPTFTSSSVLVEMRKSDDKWLISQFTPV